MRFYGTIRHPLTPVDKLGKDVLAQINGCRHNWQYIEFLGDVAWYKCSKCKLIKEDKRPQGSRPGNERGSGARG